MIRVLIADDSPTARALLKEILSSDPECQVVGEARDGIEAVELTRQLRPHVVTMDLRMPRLDGFEATKEIMITAPTPIVIVTGSVAIHDVEASMDTLRAGAMALLPKPPGPESPTFEEAAGQLITIVKAMSQVKVVRHWRSAVADARPRKHPDQGTEGTTFPAAPRRPGAGSFGRILTIATSTGGPAALHRLLADLPGDFPVPILVVQHITEGFTPGLADWLNKVSPLHVKVAQQGEMLAPHTVYLAPDDLHLGLSSRSAIALSSAPPVGGFRPSGTFLFESAARAFGSSTVALILTGMGEDGVAGLRTVRQHGGRIIAQDETSCVIFGMPGSAIAAGLPDLVLPLDAMAARLVEWVGKT
jgi:two-component system chemotaxis response regulator CheB